MRFPYKKDVGNSQMQLGSRWNRLRQNCVSTKNKGKETVGLGLVSHPGTYSCIWCFWKHLLLGQFTILLLTWRPLLAGPPFTSWPFGWWHRRPLCRLVGVAHHPFGWENLQLSVWTNSLKRLETITKIFEKPPPTGMSLVLSDQVVNGWISPITRL